MPLLPTFLHNSPRETIAYAKGNILTTDNGTNIYDYTCGVTGHSIIGWGVEHISDAAVAQLQKFGHIDYKTFRDPNREVLANRLSSVSSTSLPYTFFVGGSGGEACEACIKLSYQSHINNGQEQRTTYLSRHQAYHGISSDNLSLGDRPNLQLYSPFFPANRFKIPEHNFYRHAFQGETLEEYGARSCLEFEAQLQDIGPQSVGGLILETVMGGLVGDVPPAPNYLSGISAVCQRHGIHLILDEVWCGNGVSGNYFCYDWFNVVPDFVFFGKTLAAGYSPISALMTSAQIYESLLKHDGRIQFSTTFQGHSLCSAIALSVFDYVHNNNLVERASFLESHIKQTLSSSLSSSRYLSNIRGKGIRISLENKAPEQHLFSIELGNRLLEIVI